LGLKEGDRVLFVQRDEEVLLKVLKGSILDLKGSVRVRAPQDFDRIRRQVKKKISARIARDG